MSLFFWPPLALLISSAVLLALLLALALGLRATRPAARLRRWRPDLARVAHGSITGDKLVLHNVRNNRYGPPGSPYATVWETREYDLGKLRRLWFAVEPFRPSLPVIAHNLISFEFEDDFLAFSAEARIEEGGSYSILRGLAGAFELAYTFGDERDFIARRTNYLGHHLYLYPLVVPPQGAKALLIDLVRTANTLAAQPRFYDSVFANCTSVLMRHANRVRPGSFPPFLLAQVMPGLSDKALHDRGWIDTDLPWESVREAHDIKDKAARYAGAPAFSRRIRENLLRS